MIVTVKDNNIMLSFVFKPHVHIKTWTSHKINDQSKEYFLAQNNLDMFALRLAYISLATQNDIFLRGLFEYFAHDKLR